MIDHVESIRERQVWTPAPDDVRAQFRAPLPRLGRPFEAVLEDFDKNIKPYSTGNGHPGFMGWVHGAGTPIGMVAEMLAAGLNANCGGRNHIGIDVERQVTLWMAEALGFPETSAGLFVTGTSIANFLGLLIARNHRLGDDVRKTGLSAADRLVAYASQAAHGCITQALQLAGLGSDALRLIPCDASGARGFRALKTWFTLTTLGTDRLGAAIEKNCKLAERLASHIRRSQVFQLSAPASLNIVCFSCRGLDRDAQNRSIVEALHNSGRWAPSITMLDGVATIRCAIVNHRTSATDIDAFFGDVERIGGALTPDLLADSSE